MWLLLWCVNLALKELGADLLRPAPERRGVLEEGGLRVYGAGRSHPPALAASGAVWSSVSEPVALSSVAHCAVLTHPEMRKRMRRNKGD